MHSVYLCLMLCITAISPTQKTTPLTTPFFFTWSWGNELVSPTHFPIKIVTVKKNQRNCVDLGCCVYLRPQIVFHLCIAIIKTICCVVWRDTGATVSVNSNGGGDLPCPQHFKYEPVQSTHKITCYAIDAVKLLSSNDNSKKGSTLSSSGYTRTSRFFFFPFFILIHP